jgi:hypothetical protein
VPKATNEEENEREMRTKEEVERMEENATLYEGRGQPNLDAHSMQFAAPRNGLASTRINANAQLGALLAIRHDTTPRGPRIASPNP